MEHATNAYRVAAADLLEALIGADVASGPLLLFFGLGSTEGGRSPPTSIDWDWERISPAETAAVTTATRLL